MLAIKASEVNGIVETEEKELLKEYCHEMMVEYPNDSTVVAIDDIYDFFSKSSDAHKRIIVFELLGFMYVDGLFDEEERDFVCSFVDAIHMEDGVFESILLAMDRYVEIVTELSEIILLDEC